MVDSLVLFVGILLSYQLDQLNVFDSKIIYHLISLTRALVQVPCLVHLLHSNFLLTFIYRSFPYILKQSQFLLNHPFHYSKKSESNNSHSQTLSFLS